MPDPLDAAAARRRKARYLLLSLLILVADQWTKWLIEIHVPLHVAEPIVPGFLNLTHVRNTGVAFGMFPAGSHLPSLLGLVGMSLLAMGVVAYYFLRTPAEDRGLLVALALVLGGAVGNLIDRLFAGAVTDFVDAYVGLHHWPAFNVADSAITIGLCLLAIDALRPHRAATT